MSIGAIATVIGTLVVIAVLAIAGWAEYRKRTLRKNSPGSGHGAAADEPRLVPLSADDAQYYRTAWDHAQGGFLDNPATALTSAEQLIGTMLDVRGYAPGAYRAAAYLAARGVAAQAETDPTAVSTEEMRRALMQFHEVFDGLLTDAGAPEDSQRVQEAEVTS